MTKPTDIYRGCDLQSREDGWWWQDANLAWHGPYAKGEQAMDAVDAWRQAQLAEYNPR